VRNENTLGQNSETTRYSSGLETSDTASGARTIAVQAERALIRWLLDDTVYVVEADEFAQHHLYNNFRCEVEWDFDPRCYSVNVGTFGGEPVTLRLLFSKINGKRVLFYAPSSRVVNHDMVDKWLMNYCNPTRSGGLQRAHANAMNFHQVIDFCRRS
jgi:hypothetical protein